jgi:hypothetical protein
MRLARRYRPRGARPNVRLVQVGSRDEVPFAPRFDKVLVDCALLGALAPVRRDPTSG